MLLALSEIGALPIAFYGFLVERRFGLSNEKVGEWALDEVKSAVLVLVLGTMRTRIYGLKVQDRVIRLEERLRLIALLPESMRPRIHELTEGQLVALRVDSLFITGGATSGCVRASAVDAFSNNYPSTLIADCCFDRFEASHAMTLFDLGAKYVEVAKSFFEDVEPGFVNGALDAVAKDVRAG